MVEFSGRGLMFEMNPIVPRVKAVRPPLKIKLLGLVSIVITVGISVFQSDVHLLPMSLGEVYMYI